MKNAALSHFNIDHVDGLSLPGRVMIYDSTLRDGEQMPGVAFSLDEKVEIAEMLSGIGVRQIEAGFPAVSEGERKAVRKIANLKTGSEILALARTCKKDIDAALDCDVDMLMLFTASSDLHLEHKLRRSREELKEDIARALDYAREHGLKFSFSTEDSTRTEIDFLIELSRLAEGLGACRIGLADTTGCILPAPLGKLVRELRKEVGAEISVHLHNDFGLALANTLTALDNGASAVATTVNGIGERAGNVPFEQLVMALEQFCNVDTGIDTTGLIKLCTRVSEISGVPLSPNRPWVGENIFKHESGIHVASILSNPFTYECVLPEVVGGKRSFILGKHSGTVSLKHRLGQMGVELGDEDIKRILLQVKHMARSEKHITDEMLVDIIESVRSRNEP